MNNKTNEVIAKEIREKSNSLSNSERDDLMRTAMAVVKQRPLRPPIEFNEPAKLGRFYSVPCIFTNYWNRTIPIIGPLHEDRDIIGFPDDHWHIDWRFVDKSWYDFISKYHIPHGKVISEHNTDSLIVRKNLKCKRAMPEFPATVRQNEVPWLKKLEQSFSGVRLKPDLVCPHRGINLSGCPVKDGIVVCPGHGLAWCLSTGELAKRSNKSADDQRALEIMYSNNQSTPN